MMLLGHTSNGQRIAGYAEARADINSVNGFSSFPGSILIQFTG
jgi:hypothetical protein